MAKQPSFNFGANVKKPKASKAKKGGKGKKKLTKAQAGSIDWGSSKSFSIPD